MRLILVTKKIEKEKKRKQGKEKKSEKDIDCGSDQSDDTIILGNLSATEEEGPCQSTATVILSATEEEGPCQSTDTVILSATEEEGPCPLKQTQPSRGLVYWSLF